MGSITAWGNQSVTTGCQHRKNGPRYSNRLGLNRSAWWIARIYFCSKPSWPNLERFRKAGGLTVKNRNLHSP
jgi:hypothetical protein